MKPYACSLFLAIAVVLAGHDRAPAQQSQTAPVCDCQKTKCVKFGETLILEGMLTTKSAGQFMLNIDRPICALGTHNSKDFNDAEDAAAQVTFHIAFTGDDADNLLKKAHDAIGHRIRLTCSPFAWETAWHQTPIMLDSEKFDLLN